MHSWQGEKPMVQLDCQAWIYTKVGATESAVPASMLNILMDGIERALYPTPRGFRQQLGVSGVIYCRIDGEVQKDPGHMGGLASITIPLTILVGAGAETYTLT
jgi:hypothetical protein